MKEFELVAKTYYGLEEILAKELTELGANNVTIGRRAVSFTGDQALMYRANLYLRTAIRILKPILKFKASDADAVYDRVIDIDLSKLKPLIACPHSPDNVVTVESLKGTKVDQVCIGSCTNSSLLDMLKVAALLKGKVASKHKIPLELAERLVGDTEEALEKDAETFAGFMAPQSAPPMRTNDFSGGSGANNLDAAYASLLSSMTQ